MDREARISQSLSQGPSFWASVRARLLLLIFLAILPALGLALYTGLEHRRIASSQAQQEALRLARIASSEHERLIEGARQLLIALSTLPSVRMRDASTCSAFFTNLLKQYPLYANFGVVHADGNVFCSALPLAGRVSLADRAYIRRAIETRDFAVGDYQIGRITGKATINFGYPVVSDTGAIETIVFAALDLAWLSRLVTNAQLPPDSVLAVIDRNGRILTRYPDSEKWIGRATSELPITKTVLVAGEGVAAGSGVDGISRLYGFTTLHSTSHGPDMYVRIGISRSVAYAEANRLLARSLIELGLVGALTIAAAWVFGDLFILRGVRALVHGTERLKAGDLTSRVQVTGRGELGALATSFNDMADHLQAAYSQLTAHVKELTHRERELSLLREIDQAMLAGVPLRDLLSEAVEAFARLADSKTCVLVTADPESGELKLIAIWGPDQEAIRRYFATLKPRAGEEGGSLGRAIALRTAVLSPDITNDPQMERHRDPLLALGIRAILAVPLLTDQQILGAVGIGYPAARTFPEAEVRVMEGFASQLAVAWEQARLREEAKERWRLEEASQVKALFIANMSHELRTPLNSVIGFAELLQDETFGPLSDKQRRYVRHIHESGKHLLALISDILDLSKVEVGKIELHPEPLLISDALEASVALLRDQAAKKSLALELQIEEGLPQIMADPVRLKQILFNLLSNAVKFTPDGGRITVTARRAPHYDDFVEIVVADIGIGIKPEDLLRLFQAFVRLDAAVAHRAEGTGLGLALTKKLVELHGGTITAASEGEGRGSTFTVRLPPVPAPRD